MPSSLFYFACKITGKEMLSEMLGCGIGGLANAISRQSTSKAGL
ncbi:hypothetical protein BH10CHL1_BH10CHL1_21100 [soil metagenome]